MTIISSLAAPQVIVIRINVATSGNSRFSVLMWVTRRMLFARTRLGQTLCGTQTVSLGHLLAISARFVWIYVYRIDMADIQHTLTPIQTNTFDLYKICMLILTKQPADIWWHCIPSWQRRNIARIPQTIPVLHKIFSNTGRHRHILGR